MTQTPATSATPLFYSAPILLRFQNHGGYGLRQGGDLRFAAAAAAIPLTLGEFAAAGRHYPIVFSSDDSAMPLAVTGLDTGRNLFVTAEGGWRTGCYIPAYVRRYPFITIEVEAAGPRMLGIDSASPQLSADAARDGADPLFDAQGGPTERARAAMAFCDAYAGDYDRTAAFARALTEHNLLVPKTAEVTYNDSVKSVVTGFRTIDEAVFRALPEKTVLEFHANGWLDLMTLHLASQIGWQFLIDVSAESRAKAA